MAMNPEELAAATERAKGEGSAAERQRTKDILASFPDDPGFAAEQVSKGATLAEAKAAYADVVVAKNKELSAKLEKLQKGGAPTRGEDPLRPGGDPATAGGQGFVDAAKAYAKEHGCTVSEAMSKLAQGSGGVRNSRLYDQHLSACSDAAPDHNARKRQLGVS